MAQDFMLAFWWRETSFITLEINENVLYRQSIKHPTNITFATRLC
jgi:hypothetical protein